MWLVVIAKNWNIFAVFSYLRFSDSWILTIAENFDQQFHIRQLL